jgi:hypothetical protein
MGAHAYGSPSALGARGIAQFEVAGNVAKLAAARKRQRECEGRKPLSETRPEGVALAHKAASSEAKLRSTEFRGPSLGLVL